MDFYDNLTFDPDRGVYLDKDGYPVDDRSKPLEQASLRADPLLEIPPSIFVSSIEQLDPPTAINIAPFTSTSADFGTVTSNDIYTDAIHPHMGAPLVIEQATTVPELSTDILNVTTVNAGVPGVVSVTDPLDVNPYVTTLEVLTDTINARTGAGPIAVGDPITVNTSVTSPDIIGTATVTAPDITGTNSVTAPFIVGTTLVSAPAVSGTTSVTTPLVNTDFINAVTGSGPIQIEDPIDVVTSVTTPAVVGTSTVTAPTVTGSTHVVTPQVDASVSHLTLKGVGATDRIKIGNANASTGLLEVQPGATNQIIQATTAAANSDITLIPKGIGIVDCSTYTLFVDSLDQTQQINLSGTSPIERILMSNVVINTFPASILTWETNDRIRNNSGRTLTGLICSDTRGTWQGSFPNGLLGYGFTAGATPTSLDQYWYGTLRMKATDNSEPVQSVSGASIVHIYPGQEMSVWIRAVNGQITIGTTVLANLAHRNHMTFKLLV